MNNILYSKLRLQVPSALDGQTATITSASGSSRIVTMSNPVTDIMVSGMEQYRIQGGDSDETVGIGYGEIKKVEIIYDIYNTVKNSTSDITEAQWLSFLNEGCVAMARSKGETSAFIGKNVILSNSVVPDYTSWKIADFNHDSSGNTVDLIQNNTIYNTAFSSSSQTYSSSTARSWLTGTYLPGFSTDVKNKLQTMTVTTDGGNTSDKIKLLSVTEVGGSGTSYAPTGEGSQYPIFTASTGSTANNSRVRTGTGVNWWLRSRYTNNTSLAWAVTLTGYLDYFTCSGTCGLLPTIRFAQ